jgi:hypothetical protein
MVHQRSPQEMQGFDSPIAFRTPLRQIVRFVETKARGVRKLTKSENLPTQLLTESNEESSVVQETLPADYFGLGTGLLFCLPFNALGFTRGKEVQILSNCTEEHDIVGGPRLGRRPSDEENGTLLASCCLK